MDTIYWTADCIIWAVDVWGSRLRIVSVGLVSMRSTSVHSPTHTAEHNISCQLHNFLIKSTVYQMSIKLKWSVFYCYFEKPVELGNKNEMNDLQSHS